MKQLSLQLEIPKHCAYDLCIEPVSEKIALGAERFHIISKRFEDGKLIAQYRIPGQWTKSEVVALHSQIKGVLWQISDNPLEENRPRDNEQIYYICESFCRMNSLRHLTLH